MSKGKQTGPRPSGARDGSNAKEDRENNVAQLRDIPTEQEDGTMRILVCQMGGCASIEMRKIKIAATE